MESFSQVGFALLSYISEISTFTALAILCRILAGIGNAAAITAVYAIGATHFQNQATFVISLIDAVLGMGFMVGSLVGAALFAINNTMVLPLLILGVLYLLATFRFIMFFKTDKKEDSSIHFKGVLSTLQLLKFAEIWYPIVIIGNTVGIFGFLLVYLTAYLQTIHMNVLQSGILFSINSVSYMIGCSVIGKLANVYSKYTPYGIFVGLIGYSTILMGFTGQTQQWIPYVGMVFYGFFSAVANINSLNYSLNSLKQIKIDMNYEERCGALAGIWTSARNSAKFLFALGGGFMINWTGSIAITNFGLAIFGYALSIFVVLMNLYIRWK